MTYFKDKYMVNLIKQHFKDRHAEWIVGIALIFWGTIVLGNPDLFTQVGLYHKMVNLASQKVWGYCAVAIGTLRITFLIINGTWKRSAHLRALGSGLSACLWAAIWSSYFTLDNIVPNLATIGALLALDIYSVWSASAEAKHSDIRTKEDSFIVKQVRRYDYTEN
jgi:hypothetical protein